MPVLVQNAEKVRQMYEAFNKGDIPSILSNLHPDCVMEIAGQPEIPYAGIYHGVEDCRNFFNKMGGVIGFTEMTPEHIFEEGNLVITAGNTKGSVRKNNKLFSSLFCMIFEFNEDGQLTHFRDCVDTLTLARAINS